MLSKLFRFISPQGEVILWAAVALTVSLLGVYFVHHERELGAAKIEASDEKVRVLQEEANKRAEDIAVTTIATIGPKYEITIASPTVDPPHVSLCSRSADRSPAGEARVTAQGDNGTSIVPGSGQINPTESPVDIGPDLDAVGRDADAQVMALQEYIQALLKELAAADAHP